MACLPPLGPASFGRPLAELQASISELGLLRPLWVAAGPEGGWLLVAGRRRAQALLALGCTQAPALILPASYTRAQLLRLSLADNVERGWNAAEQALIWAFLSQNLSAPEAEPLAAALGLAASAKMRSHCLLAAGLSEQALTALAEDRLDLESAARLAACPEPGRQALLNIFERLSPSRQKRRLWLELLEDLVRRDAQSVEEILAQAQAETAEAERQGKAAEESALRQALWLRRYPRLAGLTALRRQRLKALELPPALRLDLDPSLEDQSFDFHLSFEDLASFERLLEFLNGLPQREEFRGLLADAPPESGDE